MVTIEQIRIPACRSFNAGRYDPLVARSLSPDPIVQASENTQQSYNSYSYVMNNPLRFTDPSGFIALDNCDWFVNSKTGDVYYNTEYRKGDDDKIEGEGWEHFAENGKLNASGEESVDLNILFENQELADNLMVDETGKVILSSGDAVTSFSAEATFKGADAEELMSGQGYDLRPVQQTIYDQCVESSAPGPGDKTFTIITGSVITITEKVNYIESSSIEFRRIQMTDVFGDIRKSTLASAKVARYKITYTDNKILKLSNSITSITTPVTGTHDYRSKKNHRNWLSYPMNNNLINKFLDINGTH